MRYLVIWRRNDGIGSAVGDPAEFTDKDAAEARIDELYAGWLKLHHGQYEIVPFEPEQRAETLATEKVAPYF